MRYRRSQLLKRAAATTLLVVWGGNACPAEARKPRTCVVDVRDETKRMGWKKLRAAVQREAAMVMQLVSVSQWRDATAAVAHETDWAPPKLRVAKELALDLWLEAQLKRRGRNFTLHLQATLVHTSEERSVRMNVGRRAGMLNRRRIRKRLRVVLRRLVRGATTRRPKPSAGPNAQPEPSTLDTAAPVPATASKHSAPAHAAPPKAEDGEWSEATSGWDESPSAEPTIRTAAGKPSQASSKELFQLRAKVGTEFFGYLQELDYGRVNARAQVDFSLEARLEMRHVRAVGRAILRHDFANPERDRADVDEGFVEVSGGPLTLQAGRVKTGWGTANLFNPADVLDQIDLRDFLEQESWGTWLVRTGVVLGPVLLEAYYLPVPQAHVLPLPNGFDEQGNALGPWRWMPPGLELPPDTTAQVDLRLDGPPGASLHNSQFAARMALSLPLLDVALGYAWRFDPIPTVRSNVQPDPDNPTVLAGQITSEYHRLHLVTLEAESTIGAWRIAAEGVMGLSEDWDASDPEIVNPYVTTVLGLDYQTPELWGESRFHLFIELTTSFALRGELQEGLLSMVRFPVPLGLGFRLRYHWSDRLVAETTVITALDAYDMVVRPQVSYTFFDRVVLSFGADLLLGTRGENLFGLFLDNTRLFARLEATF